MNAIDIVRRTLGTPGQRGAHDIRGPSGINVSEVERAVSMLLGGVLMAQGIRRRSFGGAMAALAGGELVRRGVTGHSNLYQKFNLHTAGGRTIPKVKPQKNELEIMRAMTIRRPPEELYRLWRDPQTNSRLMEEYADVTFMDEKRSHWSVRAPLGRRIEWDSEIVEDQPNQRIGWQARSGDLPNDGSVEFRPGPADWGTEVLLRMRFQPPGGMLVRNAMELLGFVPKQMAYKVLWRLKALAETGDIPSIKNQPAGRDGGRDR